MIKRKDSNKLYVDMHVLHTFPPNCMNTDDMRNVKKAEFGGVTRARVSSQSQKHAARVYFGENFEGDDWNGCRSFAVGDEVAFEIESLDPTIENAFSLAEKAFENVNVNFTDLKKNQSASRGPKALAFLSAAQIKALAAAAVADYHCSKSMQELLEKEDGTKYDYDAAGDAVEASLVEKGFSANDARKLRKNAMNYIGVETDDKKKKNKSDAGNADGFNAARFAELAEECVKYDEDFYTRAINEAPAVDMVLFGRMFAENSDLDIDACCQVAHALTTHTARIEYDPFSAVDDIRPKGHSGAAHINETEFCEATLYRYASVNVHKMLGKIPSENIGDVVAGFVEAFAMSLPTGKTNSFATNTKPSLIYVAIRDDCPVNLAPAFENPVVTRGGGYIEKSIEALAEYENLVTTELVKKPVFSRCVDVLHKAPDIAEKAPLEKTLDDIKNYIDKFVSKN